MSDAGCENCGLEADDVEYVEALLEFLCYDCDRERWSADPSPQESLACDR